MGNRQEDIAEDWEVNGYVDPFNSSTYARPLFTKHTRQTFQNMSTIRGGITCSANHCITYFLLNNLHCYVTREKCNHTVSVWRELELKSLWRLNGGMSCLSSSSNQM